MLSLYGCGRVVQPVEPRVSLLPFGERYGWKAAVWRDALLLFVRGRRGVILMLWIMIITFLLTVVASTVIALEYARIDSIAVDYKVEGFEHTVGSFVPIEAVRTNSTVGGEGLDKNY